MDTTSHCYQLKRVIVIHQKPYMTFENHQAQQCLDKIVAGLGLISIYSNSMTIDRLSYSPLAHCCMFNPFIAYLTKILTSLKYSPKISSVNISVLLKSEFLYCIYIKNYLLKVSYIH